MMRIPVVFFTALIASIGLIAGSAPAWADEATVRQMVEARFSAKVDGVVKTGYGGLYEVRLGETLVYTDEKVNFLLVGSLIDAKTRENITETRKEKLGQVNFDELPLESAVKVVRGNGKSVFAVFADPNCAFCKRFERDLATLQDVTIYTFLYPILDPGNGGDSMRKSKAIWCSKDRGKAWLDLMQKSVAPIMAGNCDTTVLQRNLELGTKLGISGTPTSFAANGQRIVGARFPELRKAIELVKK